MHSNRNSKHCLACSDIGSKRLCRGGGKPHAFLYELSEILLENRLFLITSDRELRRNRHDIYESNMNNKQ
jgi:hypothetical protein